MQDLINRFVQNLGIDPATAQPAIGVVLNLLKNVLPEGTVQSLMSAIPGSDALLSAADSDAGSGRLTGMLGGALASMTGGTGAVTKALGQPQGLGLDHVDVEVAGQRSRQFCDGKRATRGRRRDQREHAGSVHLISTVRLHLATDCRACRVRSARAPRSGEVSPEPPPYCDEPTVGRPPSARLRRGRRAEGVRPTKSTC